MLPQLVLLGTHTPTVIAANGMNGDTTHMGTCKGCELAEAKHTPCHMHACPHKHDAWEWRWQASRHACDAIRQCGVCTAGTCSARVPGQSARLAAGSPSPPPPLLPPPLPGPAAATSAPCQQASSAPATLAHTVADSTAIAQALRPHRPTCFYCCHAETCCLSLSTPHGASQI